MGRIINCAIASSVLLGLTACSSSTPELTQNAVFDGQFLAVSDADMTASAYATGRLEPIEAQDTVTLIDGNRVLDTELASNSVISWPQIADVSPDGRFAFVVETKGAAAPGVSAYDSVYTDFPDGTALSILQIGENGLDVTDRQTRIGLNLQSVEFADPYDFLVVASEAEREELVIVPVDEAGVIGPVRRFNLDITYKDTDTEKRVRTIHVAPDGVTLAVNIANNRVQFFRLALDEMSLPVGVEPLGPPTGTLGSRLSTGKWTPNGRYFIIADTNWADSQLHMLTQGPGSLSVLSPPETAGNAPKVVNRTEVGLSPEGFGISADGRHVATINMERTYLPDSPLLSWWPGRNRYSVSLLSLDESGKLAELDRIYHEGVLPEDVIFDQGGNNLAVAVFHRRAGPEREQGFIDFFSIESGRLISQNATLPVTRGAHDLVRIP